MEPEGKSPGVQFGLRSLLVVIMWVALVLAICVGYQRAVARQRALNVPWPVESMEPRGY